MPIVYSAVAFQRTVLHRHACCDGNFDDILSDVISKVSSYDDKMTYYHGRYLFHFIMENEHLYFCITDKLCQRSRAFLFLNEIKRRYGKNKGSFTQTLSEQMMCYNDDDSTITINKGDIDEVNTIGVDSSESLLGEKILIVNNDHSLQYSTISYVETKPETVMISFNNNNYIVFVIASIVIAIALFVINPMFVIVILLAILYTIVR